LKKHFSFVKSTRKMPHTKTSSNKEFHRDVRKQRKWQGILFQAIPKLFARWDALFEPLQIEVVSFYIHNKQWTSWGNGQYRLDDCITGQDLQVFPYINGFVRFKTNKYTTFQFRTMSQPHEFTESSVFQLSAWGTVWDKSTKAHGEQMKRMIAEWYRDTLNMFKMSKRINRLKKDIIAAAWHPRRVEKWLEAGVQLEDL
jgi:hypothetical protein